VTAYIIGYDIHPTKDEKYENLTEAIKNIGSTWWHHLDSTWVVVSDKTASEIRDVLKNHMYKDDQLLVMKSSGVASWYGFNENGSKWLKKYL
jgi:hypothetical protein